MDIVIREISSLPDLRAAMDLQKAVWKLPDYADCIPEHMVTAVIHAGGTALGAYQGDRLAGFLMALPAVNESGQLYHYSHILGVYPEFAGKNIGFKLKTKHFEIAAQSGIAKVCWTFDPLLGQNAKLNVGKLGATVSRYYMNYYGEEMGGSELTSGMPSDRFWAVVDTGKYATARESVHKNVDTEPVNSVSILENGLQQMTGFTTPGDKPTLLLEIPSDFQDLFNRDKSLAVEWRLKTRKLFQELFDIGYTVTGFITQHNDYQKNFYILSR